jgi:hypothetical protein
MPENKTTRRSLDEIRREIEKALPGHLISYGAGHLLWQTQDGYLITAQQQASNDE